MFANFHHEPVEIPYASLYDSNDHRREPLHEEKSDEDFPVPEQTEDGCRRDGFPVKRKHLIGGLHG
jgi:hypothetical protein